MKDMLQLNQDQMVSAITKALVGASAAWAGAHGFSATDWGNIVAYLVAAGAIIFAHWWHSAASASTPPQTGAGNIGVKLMLFIVIALPAIVGCAYMKSNTHSVTSYTTNGVQIVEQDTHSRAFTFFDANSSLSKFRNGSDKTTWGTNIISPGTYASGINEASSSSGVSNLVQAALNLAVQAAASGVK